MLEDYHQRQALTLTARVAPDIYIDLLATHARALDAHKDFGEWSDSIRELSLEQRHRLWTRVKTTRNAHELFWVIAAGSIEWIFTAFKRDTVQIEPERLLHTSRCQNGPGIPFEELAALFMPLGVQPDGLLWLLEVGTHWGEDHERYSQHLEQCRLLVNSHNPDLARAGCARRRTLRATPRRSAKARKRRRSPGPA